jgi:hypothetical protein
MDMSIKMKFLTLKKLKNMFNKEILDELVRQFGVTNVILFCKMESAKNEILYQDCMKGGDNECVEYDFERDWWKKEGNELTQNLKK